LISERGAPKALRSDNGPEFVSTRLLQWASDEGLKMALSQPGKPWQNGTDESFNGKLRDECLSMEYFRKRLEARVVIEQWRRHYNEVRPHSALGYLTPAQYVQNQSGNDHEAIRLKQLVVRRIGAGQGQIHWWVFAENHTFLCVCII